MTPFFKIDEKIEKISDFVLEKCKNQFDKIDKITEYNQL